MSKATVQADQVRSGDVFDFRGSRLIALCNVWDERSSVCQVVAVPPSTLKGGLEGVVVLQLARLFPVEVLRNVKIDLRVLEHTKEELASISLREEKSDARDTRPSPKAESGTSGRKAETGDDDSRDTGGGEG